MLDENEIAEINGQMLAADNVLTIPRDTPQPFAGGTGDADKSVRTPLYDPQARNRFEYEVRSGGQKFDIAHVFGPLSDERYMQWTRELKVRGTADDISEESREATARLWDDIIVEVENIEYDPDADWKALIPSGEKLEAVNDLLAVAVVEPEETTHTKLRLGAAATQTIVTEAYFNGEVTQQTHVLAAKSFELEKKYERIQAKRIRQEPTKGLRRKPKIEYIPQDDKLGGLYDEMLISTTGFVGEGYKFTDVIPLRFKVLVINYIFAPTLDQKKLGK